MHIQTILSLVHHVQLDRPTCIAECDHFLSVAQFVKDVAAGFLPSWRDIAQRRRAEPFTDQQRQWQLLRRGRSACPCKALHSHQFQRLLISNDTPPGWQILAKSFQVGTLADTAVQVPGVQPPERQGGALRPAPQRPAASVGGGLSSRSGARPRVRAGHGVHHGFGAAAGAVEVQGAAGAGQRRGTAGARAAAAPAVGMTGQVLYSSIRYAAYCSGAGPV